MDKLWKVLILVITTIGYRADDDVSCHNITEGDALPSIEDASFSPPADSIFFHETSCRGVLISRQACAVESAAKAHPGRNIYVIFSSPVTLNELYNTRSSLSELKNYYPNIYFMRVHVNEYAKNTAFEEIVTNKEHHKSPWEIVHTSDLLRLLTLYKFGGLYLDMDIIVVKPLDDLGRNWMGTLVDYNDDAVGSAVINVGKDTLGKEIMGRILKEIGTTYKPDSWDHNGPKALYRVLSSFCNTTNTVEFSRATCRGFEVYSSEYFYPQPYDNHNRLLEPGDLKFGNKTYMVHTWFKHTHDTKLEWDSPFDNLAKKHCPIMRELYGDCFGW